jgi:dinuclear metal center YbgI/SA1388 family protein
MPSLPMNPPCVERDRLLAVCNTLLTPESFTDYGPNGLQVEGKSQVGKIVSGVTASRALIEAAIEAKADAIFVHHGLFWRGQSGVVTGWMKQRLALLLAHDINLLAYHLPLDAHPELGNNAQLGVKLGFLPGKTADWPDVKRFGEQSLGFMVNMAHLGHKELESGLNLQKHLEVNLNKPVMVIDVARNAIKNIAWCTGGAQNYFEAAIAAGADAFITGEISEPQAHLARECGIAYFACGHHATERYGAPAVAALLAAQFGIEHEFIEIDNPA